MRYIITNTRTGQRFETRAATMRDAIERVDALFGWAFINVTRKGE